MQNTIEDVRRLEREFRACRKLLTALGDETRQYLLCMMLNGPCGGNRVLEIAERTNLSRPAISHHMQILKDAGMVKSRKEGTRIYYYLDPEAGQLDNLITLFCDVREFMKYVPDRGGGDGLACQPLPTGDAP